MTPEWRPSAHSFDFRRFVEVVVILVRIVGSMTVDLGASRFFGSVHAERTDHGGFVAVYITYVEAHHGPGRIKVTHNPHAISRAPVFRNDA
jgi:hypothetical protein